MKIEINMWHRALQLERLYSSKKEKLTRKIISDELKVVDNTARFIKYALQNKKIISHDLPKLNSFVGHTLVIADLHIPYQDKQAVEIVLDYAATKDIKKIVILGDLMDFYQISFFRKDPARKAMEEEFKEGKMFLNYLRDKFPDIPILYMFGNHEERLENYVLDHMPQLHGLLGSLIPANLGLQNLNIQYYLDPFKIGHLWYLHGHEKPRGGGNPEYITNVIWKYVHDNFICAHYHRQQDKMFGHISRKRFQGTCIGWLGDPQQACYQKLKNDIQGFALVEYDNKGRFKTYPKKIIQGEVF